MQKVYKKRKSIICLGIENGGPLEGDLGNLDLFYNLGIRYITLTHSSNNDICDSSTDSTEMWHGLSPFGKKLVKRMNDLGIMIDVSHISDKSFWDAINLSKAPIIVSHSCCRTLCNSPRNLTDEMIKGVAKNDGVLQLNFYPGYLSNEYNIQADEISKKNKPSQDSLKKLFKEGTEEYRREYLKLRRKFQNSALPDVSRLVDHIDHIVKLVGIDFVGIGSDFDGLSVFPKGLEDVSKLPLITYNLLKRGYTEPDIKKIVGGNFLRVWRKVEEVAQNK
jgi:membrane dipeptidase